MRGQPFRTVLAGGMFRADPLAGRGRHCAVWRRSRRAATVTTARRSNRRRGAVHLAVARVARRRARARLSRGRAPRVKLETYDTKQVLARALAASLDCSHSAPAAIWCSVCRPAARRLRCIATSSNHPTRMVVDWSRVRTFNLDEFVGLDARIPGSYRRVHGRAACSTRQHSAGKHRIPRRPRRSIGKPSASATNAAIAAAGGIDIMILGIGVNGHIGFNEPATPFAARTHRVTLDAADARRQRVVVRRRHQRRAARGAVDGDGDDPERASRSC